MTKINLGFNNMWASSVHHGLQNSTYTCGCLSLCVNPPFGTFQQGIVSYQVTSHTFEKASDMWQKHLCPKAQGQKWFDLNCVKNKCVECGFHILPLCNWEVDIANDNLMAWKHFEKVSIWEIWAWERKEVVLVCKLTNPQQFFEYVAPKFFEFDMHNHVTRW
jgi:hypothetical protein